MFFQSLKRERQLNSVLTVTFVGAILLVDDGAKATKQKR